MDEHTPNSMQHPRPPGHSDNTNIVASLGKRKRGVSERSPAMVGENSPRSDASTRVHPLVPQDVFNASPVPNTSGGSIKNAFDNGKALPLNLVILILNHINDVPTLAAITRTSRLLYYMALPRLYEHVTLRSYSQTRYFDGRPEGYGGGSPFSMALNGLMTKNVATYVKRWRLHGEWKEDGADEFKSGRVPDSVVMLNTVIRAVCDRMGSLERFSWELNTKPLATVYAGLCVRTSLKSLTIRFPNTRIPRPTVLIPPIPNLESFHAMEIDPLCYPDDISLLLLGSKNLRHLTIEWASRMRDEGEPSIHLHSYLGRCISAGYKMNLTSFGCKNLYAPNNLEFEQAVDVSKVRRVDFINCVNPADPMTIFFDNSWRFKMPSKVPTNLKVVRGDSLDDSQVQMLSVYSGLEELYFVNAKRKNLLSPTSSNSGTPITNGIHAMSSASDSPRPPSEKISVTLASDYLAAITCHHGATLRILLLSEQISLSEAAANHLIDSCPRLEQMGLAIEGKDFMVIRQILAKGKYLNAIRILVTRNTQLYETMKSVSEEHHAIGIGAETWKEPYLKLKWFGLGDSAFRMGDVIRVGDTFHRQVFPVTLQEVKHLAIWGMDTLDLTPDYWPMSEPLPGSNY